MNIVKLVFDPTIKKTQINPVCSDGKLHIRFRDFKNEEIIDGFEKKLTLILTALVRDKVSIKMGDLVNSSFKSIWNDSIQQLTLNETYNKLIKSMQNQICDYSFDMIKLTPNYRRKSYTNPWRQFGSVECDYSILFSELSTEQLVNIILDNRYYFVIEKPTTREPDKKFLNKKHKKKCVEKYTTLNLW